MAMTMRWFRRGAVATALALGLVLAGCDTVDPGSETVVLFVNVEDQLGEDLRFSFEADNAQVGQPLTVAAAQRIDLGPFLDQQGFSKAEVIAATVESATVGVRFPIQARANFMQQAALQVTATGLSATTVAAQSSFPDSREAALTVQSSRSITGFVTRSDFGVQLVLTPATLLPGEDYELTATLRIRIEVEGV